tara:strand:+ start:1107 stop:1337 length:231 start_codon:yes stop_codon:yes gene_type:complete
MPTKKTAANTTIDLEKSLKELEKLVEKLETGKLKLDESLTLFERGVKLTKDCQKALQNAKQKVEILMDDHELTDYK